MGVSQARRRALEAVKEKVPTHMPIRALIDTGASCTCIDPSVSSRLKLEVTGKDPMNTASSGSKPHEANRYDASLLVNNPDGYAFYRPNIPVSEMPLGPLGVHALIGRDVLGECLLIYDGRNGFFSLAY
jgi:hypothetical protein